MAALVDFITIHSGGMRLVAVVAICTLAAGVLTFAPARDPDVWWHLATGRRAVATRSTLPADPFSFSYAGAPWRYKDVAADVALWGAFAAAGFAGLWLVPLAAAAAIALGFALVARGALAILLASGATILLLPWAPRPNLLSLALFPAMLALLHCRKFAHATALSWLWMLLHRAALLGYVLLAARAAHLAIARALRSTRLSIVVGEAPSPRELAAACAAAAIASKRPLQL
jgi:hypothetical protein